MRFGLAAVVVVLGCTSATPVSRQFAAPETNNEGGSLASLPFSWDTVPRYTFCVNSSDPTTLTDGLFNEEALDYISKQPIYLNNPSLARPAGACTMEEERQPRQAQALLKKNPKQRQWFYYAIDLIRPHAFENDNWMEYHPECRLKDKNGVPVPRSVWDFGSQCGTERWLNTSRAMVAGGLNGIFLDGFQGCDPFTKGGCTRVCTSKAGCDPAVLERWNAGLRAAMWRLKREILGENGTFICNSTPGPYACVGNTTTPVETNFLVFTENLLEDTDGLWCGGGAQSISDLSGAAACGLLFMLTCAILMTSSQSKAGRRLPMRRN